MQDTPAQDQKRRLDPIRHDCGFWRCRPSLLVFAGHFVVTLLVTVLNSSAVIQIQCLRRRERPEADISIEQI